MLPSDPFGRCVRAPGDFTRHGRIALLGDTAIALLSGRMPSDEGRVFLAGALLAWLRNGGSLERDYFRTTPPQGSKLRADRVWQELGGDVISDERQDRDAPAD